MRRALAILCLAAIALRLAAVLYLGVPNIVGYSESGIVANNMVQGRGFTFDLFGVRREHPLRSYMPPLFPALLAFCLRFFSKPGLALGVIQAFLSGLAIIPFFWAATWLAGDRRVGWLAAVAAAGYPVTVIMSAYPPSLTLDLFLFALSLGCVIRLAQKPTGWQAALTGVCLGLASLSRPVTLGMVPCIWLWLAILGGEARQRLFKIGMEMVIGLVLVLMPWTIRNYWVQGHFVLISTNGGHTFWDGNNPFTTGSGLEVDLARLAHYQGQAPEPDPPVIRELFPYPLPLAIQSTAANMDEVALERAHWRAALAFIRSDPQRWAQLVWAKVVGFLWFRTNIGVKYEPVWTRYYKIAYGALIVWVVPGIGLAWRRWRHFSLLYLLIAYHLLVYVVFHMQTRYRWVFEPYYLIFAALTLLWLWDRLPVGTSRKAWTIDTRYRGLED